MTLSYPVIADVAGEIAEWRETAQICYFYFDQIFHLLQIIASGSLLALASTMLQILNISNYSY